MNVNFPLCEKIWWRSDIFPYTNQQIIEEIARHIHSIEEFASTPENQEYIREYSIYNKTVFLRECLIGERNIQSESIEFIEEVIARNDPQTREETKIVNTFEAINHIFIVENGLFRKPNVADLNSDLAKRVNAIIGKRNLFPKPGEYRCLPAKPAGENFEYLNHSQIEHEMDKLFFYTRCELEKCKKSDIEAIIKMAAQFLQHFLFIHPFSNGNGRTARILVSYLLSGVSIIPLSLTNEKCPDDFIRCLQEARKGDYGLLSSPSSLATYILERIMISLEVFKFALDIS